MHSIQITLSRAYERLARVIVPNEILGEELETAGLVGSRRRNAMDQKRVSMRWVRLTSVVVFRM